MITQIQGHMQCSCIPHVRGIVISQCIAGREMGKILGELGKRSLGEENENPVEEGFNGVGMGLK